MSDERSQLIILDRVLVSTKRSPYLRSGGKSFRMELALFINLVLSLMPSLFSSSNLQVEVDTPT